MGTETGGAKVTNVPMEATGFPDDGYLRDLFKITRHTHLMHGDQEHPDLKGLSAGAAHSNPGTQLKPREWAAQQNADRLSNDPSATKEYHEDRPVIRYCTDMDASDLLRAHHEQNKEGPYATRGADINQGHLPGEVVKEILSIPPKNSTPTHVSEVHPDIGTEMYASRPLSGQARQYRLTERISSWFTNTRKLG